MKAFSKGDKVQLNGSEGTSRVGVVTNVYRDGYVTTHELWWAKVMWETLQPYPTSKHPHEELRHATPISKPRNHCNPWTQDEDDKLMRAVRKCQRDVGHLAFVHGRTEIAITSRLHRICEVEARSRQQEHKVPSRTDERSLFDYIRDQRSGFTRRAVRALWSDQGYVERQGAYKQGFTAAQLKAAGTAATEHFAQQPNEPIKLKAKLSFTQMVPPCADFAGIEARMFARMFARMYGHNYRGSWFDDPVSTTKEEKPMEKFYSVMQRGQLGEMTKAEALAEAQRLARDNPHRTYVILEAVQSVSQVQPEVAVTTLKAPKVVRAKRKAKRSK